MISSVFIEKRIKTCIEKPIEGHDRVTATLMHAIEAKLEQNKAEKMRKYLVDLPM